MKKNIEIELELTSEELALNLWEMDDVEQAEFLFELSRLYRFNKMDFLKQLRYVADEINCEVDIYDKALIIRTLETILEYIKEAGEDL